MENSENNGEENEKHVRHDYGYEEAKSGYGICKCGARENSDMSLIKCPNSINNTEKDKAL